MVATFSDSQCLAQRDRAVKFVLEVAGGVFLIVESEGGRSFHDDGCKASKPGWFFDTGVHCAA